MMIRPQAMSLLVAASSLNVLSSEMADVKAERPTLETLRTARVRAR
jgi:hypothetical protein